MIERDGFSRLRVEVCRDTHSLQALESEWRALSQLVPTHNATQTFDYVRVAWEATRERNNVELATVLVWRDQRLVCAWPLYTRRHGRIVFAEHLGSGSNEEYSGPPPRRSHGRGG